jgi:hypothetical protein
LSMDGRVKVLDLGLSCLHSASHQAGGRVDGGDGTRGARSAASQQSRDGRTVDVGEDLYSLGLILNCLLTGQSQGEACRPDSGSLQNRMTMPAYRQLGETLPAGVAAVLKRVLAPERDNAYASAADVAEALTPFAGPVHATGRS